MVNPVKRKQVKYTPITPSDIRKGDVIYFLQKQNSQTLKPFKYRPFLVMNALDDVYDLVPITHSDPAKKNYQDPFANYNMPVSSELNKALIEKSGDRRSNFINASQEFTLYKEDFTKECNLQKMVKNQDYPVKEQTENFDSMSTGQDKLEDDYPRYLPERFIVQMHYGEALTSLDPLYPDDNFPVTQKYIEEKTQDLPPEQKKELLEIAKDYLARPENNQSHVNLTKKDNEIEL